MLHKNLFIRFFMSDMKLLAQINNLFNEGDFEEVVSIVESLPEEKKDYHLLFLLASAYSELSDYYDDEHEYNHKTLKILQKIQDQGENDIRWLYLIGRTYFNSTLEEYAIEYFEKVNRICKKDNDISEYVNLQHFVNYCKECLHDRALAMIFTTLEEASKDKDLSIENIHDNHVEVIFPKYKTKVLIDIFDLRRNGARVEFKTILPDNKTDKFSVEGNGHTYENGITDALNRYISHYNEHFRQFLK